MNKKFFYVHIYNLKKCDEYKSRLYKLICLLMQTYRVIYREDVDKNKSHFKF